MCGLERRPPDPHQPGKCPRCGEYDFELLRCTDKSENPEGGCYLTKLEDASNNSSESSILAAISDIENAINLKFTVYLDDVRADVWPALVILSEERERYRKEHPNG